FTPSVLQLAMNRKRKFPRNTRRQDRAVAVDEMNTAPHGAAAWANDLPDWAAFFLHAIGCFHGWINTQVETLRIERRRLDQFLIEIIFRDPAIRRNTKVGGD